MVIKKIGINNYLVLSDFIYSYRCFLVRDILSCLKFNSQTLKGAFNMQLIVVRIGFNEIFISLL